jgi:uracil-DNA glycosylase
MIKVLVVGMNPSNTRENVKVRRNSTVDRLNQWMSRVNVKNYSFINAVEHRGEVKHKDVDPILLRTATKDYKYVVALGGFASKALDKIRVDHFKLPHPSPRNRQLNDPSYEAESLKELVQYLKGK